MKSDMDKPFITYEKMIEKLREDNLSIADEEKTKNLLTKLSYFDLISGYKEPFKGKDSKFKTYTTIDDIYVLYKFDENLREIIIRYIFKIEKHIKSLISYAFCSKYGNNQSEYLNPTNYEYNNKNEIDKLVKILRNSVEDKSNIYIKHHIEKYNNVPLWVVMKASTLGCVSKMFSMLDIDMRKSISKNYDNIHYQELTKMLDFLSKVRNISAHNERLFDYRYNKRGIRKTHFHDKLSIPQNKRNEYQKGINDLFAVVIIFKCLLDDSDFKNFCNDIQNNFNSIGEISRFISLEKIYKYMGFPDNWIDIIDMDNTNAHK